MNKVNHKSDFDFFLILRNALREDIGIPDYDWTARFYVRDEYDIPDCDLPEEFRNMRHVFTASRKEGVYTNCFEDRGRLHIVFNGHRLPPGTLQCDFRAYLPNDIYPDGSRTITLPASFEIELVTYAAPCPETLEVELLMPYIKGDKGDPFVYEDFTPEQLADLRRPAEDAAGRADASADKTHEATRHANTAADAAMDAAGKAWTAAEGASSAAGEVLKTNEAITDAEQIRKEAEKTRVSNEQARGEGESLRRKAEDGRKTAETERAKSETERGTAEQTRVASESLRVKAESERKSSEESRAATENTRVEAENKRIAKENARQDAESARVKEFDRIKQEAETATSGANSAAEAANKAASNATDVADGLQSAINSKQDRLADSEDITVSEDNKLLATDSAKRQLFIDQWNAGWKYNNKVYGKYDPENAPDTEHPFYGNNIWMTYEEALRVLERSTARFLGPSNDSVFGFNGTDNDQKRYKCCRTYLPILVCQTSGGDLTRLFCDNSIVETVLIISRYGENFGNSPTMHTTFYGCTSLRKIISTIKNAKFDNLTFYNCTALETVRIYIGTNNSTINLAWSPNLSLESLLYMVANAANTTAITVTVHPDVYAKLTGDTTNDAYNDLTDEEKEQWTALVPLALSKNIAFATV